MIYHYIYFAYIFYLIDFVFDFQFAAYFFLLDSNVFFVLAFKDRIRFYHVVKPAVRSKRDTIFTVLFSSLAIA